MRNLRTISMAAVALLVVGAAVVLILPRSGTPPSQPTANRSAKVAAAPTYRPPVEDSAARQLLAARMKITGRPIEVAANGYVGSASCGECHLHEHQSWHESYHRTMTQTVTEATAPSAILDCTVEVAGQTYKFEKQSDDYIVQFPDPTRRGQKTKRRLVMMTGSHHMHVFWYESDLRRTPAMLPIIFLIDQQRWIPREAAFLQRPIKSVIRRASRSAGELGRWNQTCSVCHSTHPRQRPRSDSGQWDTHVAEFGISCEECHGPAGQHVEFHQQGGGSAADRITNPKRLPASTRSDLCGQCHGILARDFSKLSQGAFLANGCTFQPGDALIDSALVLLKPGPNSPKSLQTPDGSHIPTASYFWPDGEVRVSGREYNGLIESPCFQNGDLGCLSCHQMHEPDRSRQNEWKDDQLKVGMRGNLACTQCHSNGEKYGTLHTHHMPGSSGDQCMNCHMPHTVYGLLKTIRSHRISSPSVATTLETGRQNACNLCHLDRTLLWTSRHLHDWYSQPSPAIDPPHRTTAASVVHYLAGDAGQRAIQAAAFAWPPAQRVSGTDWMPPLHLMAADDPYDAIRIISNRSLRALPGWSDFELDPVGPDVQRTRIARDAMDKLKKELLLESRPEVLFESDGRFDHGRAAEMQQTRDTRTVNLLE